MVEVAMLNPDAFPGLLCAVVGIVLFASAMEEPTRRHQATTAVCGSLYVILGMLLLP